MIKFLHLICGTTFFGIIIVAWFYVARSIQKSDRALIDYSLKASYVGDGAIILLILIQLITSAKLVSYGHFTLAVPWIFIAYHAFASIILLWLGILLIKFVYFPKTNISLAALKVFHLLNVIMVAIFVVIIHDAVTQSTWFDFLFRK
jgi:uncharacterized membrane protein